MKRGFGKVDCVWVRVAVHPIRGFSVRAGCDGVYWASETRFGWFGSGEIEIYRTEKADEKTKGIQDGEIARKYEVDQTCSSSKVLA